MMYWLWLRLRRMTRRLCRRRRPRLDGCSLHYSVYPVDGVSPSLVITTPQRRWHLRLTDCGTVHFRSPN